MIKLTEKLEMVEFYALNQGDKFHPMSDEILAVIRDEFSAEDKVAAIRELLAANSRNFAYHVARITEYLDYNG